MFSFGLLYRRKNGGEAVNMMEVSENYDLQDGLSDSELEDLSLINNNDRLSIEICLSQSSSTDTAIKKDFSVEISANMQSLHNLPTGLSKMEIELLELGEDETESDGEMLIALSTADSGSSFDDFSNLQFRSIFDLDSSNNGRNYRIAHLDTMGGMNLTLKKLDPSESWMLYICSDRWIKLLVRCHLEED